MRKHPHMAYSKVWGHELRGYNWDLKITRLVPEPYKSVSCFAQGHPGEPCDPYTILIYYSFRDCIFHLSFQHISQS